MPPKRKRGHKPGTTPRPTQTPPTEPRKPALKPAIKIPEDDSYLVYAAKRKSPDQIKPTYLIYVMLHTSTRKVPKVIIRKTYESPTDAVDAFKREYGMWAAGEGESGSFFKMHTDAQLERSYLINIIEMKKKISALDPDSTTGRSAYTGRGKVELTLFHKDDTTLDDKDPNKRRCVIVCEETVIEGM